MTAEPVGKRRGRRAGGADTRAALLDAARAVFAEQGYDGATVRAIAGRAGVDAAMVNHWFGGKQGLFAAAVVDLPVDPGAVADGLLAGDVETLGERMIRTFISVWDHQEGPFAALVLSIASQELAGKMIAEFFTDAIFGRVAAALDVDRPQERATLCATQIIGLGLTRYVLKLEPIASADADWLARRIGPNLQNYLTGDF